MLSGDLFMKSLKYIYGPVNSWRLGRSLGIDPISSEKKICTFDCVYCQIGGAKPCGLKRKFFVPVKEIIRELKSLPMPDIDYITFSGTGEPTLEKNLGRMIKAVKLIRKEKVAVFTNSTLLNKKDVQSALMRADLVEAKLDAPSEAMFKSINRPAHIFTVKSIISGIKKFRKNYKGRLALQVMLTKDNIMCAERLAKIAFSIKPDEVHLNTPLRPSLARPASKAEIKKARKYFDGLKVLSVYDAPHRIKVKPISIKQTMSRRGKG
jgi:wyosine [tRNA(Phe)-imidazoG37] synthetase (radical SAM superfamily)